MKTFKLMVISLLSLSAINLSANEKPQELSSTVNSFMIESYNYVLNINLLIELCAMDRYLDVNVDSKEFNENLQNNIKRFAGFAKLESYDEEQIASDVKVKFQSFLQGVRYGGFIADNFLKTQYPQGLCTDEIRKDLQDKIAELTKNNEFQLSEEY